MQDLVRRVPELHSDEAQSLAKVGSLNWLYESPDTRHRRAALWDVERALRSPGPLFETLNEEGAELPLSRMNDEERIVADYEGTGLSVGHHILFFHRAYLDSLGVTQAIDLPKVPNQTWVRIAGTVTVRQRPGTAKGFGFMMLEDETGTSNAIFAPDFYESNRTVITHGSILLIEGELQNLDRTISVKMKRVEEVHLSQLKTVSHDFH